MTKRWGISVTISCVLLSTAGVATAETPVDFFHAMSVSSSQVINHHVDLKGQFDKDFVETNLTGPKMFSPAVVLGETTMRAPDASLNWYKIVEPTREPRRVLSVHDPWRGNEAGKITIEDAAFLLSPARRISDGPPSPVAESISHYKAYKILDGTPLNQKVTLKGIYGTQERMVASPVLLCIPVEERHHGEHYPIKNADHCLLVYRLQPEQFEAQVTTIDQFGMNRLKVTASEWLCALATISESVSVAR